MASNGTNDSIVLEEEIDPNYVPTEDEVIEYATWLGMDLDGDKDLFWIAREGLMAPLPANWKPCKTKDTEDIYYFNFATAESSWDHPCDGYYKRLYEEEKKKKEVSKKAENDVVRTKARQDVDQLLGKGKAESKSTKSKTSSTKKEIPESKMSIAPLADKKALPGIRGKSPLPDPIVSGKLSGNSSSRDSTPERASWDNKQEGEFVARPMSADSLLKNSKNKLPMSVLPLAGANQIRSSSPEFTDSDISPTKPTRKSSSDSIRSEDSKPERAKNKDGKTSNLRIHSAVAASSDFGSPDPKSSTSENNLRTKAPLAKIGSSLPPPHTHLSEAKDHSDHFVAEVNNSVIKNSDSTVIFDLQEEIKRLMSENMSLKESVTSLTTQIEKENKTKEALVTSQHLMQTQLSTARDENRSLRSELNKEIERRSKLDSELKDAQNQLMVENREKADMIKDLNEEISNLKIQISKKNSSIDTGSHVTTIEATDHTNKPLSADIDSLESEIKRLNKKLQDSDVKLLQSEELVSRLQSEKRKIENEAAESQDMLQRSLRSVKLEKEDLEEQLERLKRRIKEVEQNRSVVTPQEESYSNKEDMVPRSELDSIERKLARISSELLESERNYEEQTFKSKRLEQQLSSRQSEVEDLENRLSVIKRKLGDLQDRFDEAEVLSKSASSRLNSEVEEKIRLENSLKLSYDHTKSLEAQLLIFEQAQIGRTDSQHLVDLRNYQSKISQLQIDIESYQNQISLKEKEVTKLKADIAQAELSSTSKLSDSNQRDVAFFQNKERELTLRVESSERREISLQSDLATAQRRISALQEELQQANLNIDRFTHSESNHKSIILKHETTLSDLERKNSDLHRELTEKSIKCGNVSSNLDLQRINMLENELEISRQEIKDQKNLFMRTQSNRDIATASAAADANTIESLSSKVMEYDKLISKHLQRIKDLEEQLQNNRTEKDNLQIEFSRFKANQVETLNSKLSGAKEEHMKDRGLLLESQLQVEQLTRRLAIIEIDLNSAIKDREEGKEERRIFTAKLSSAETATAEARNLANTTREECKRREEKIERIESELTAKEVKLRDLEQQLYYATMDKQRLKDSLDMVMISNKQTLVQDILPSQNNATLERSQSTIQDDGALKAAIMLAVQRENEISKLQGDIRVIMMERDSLKTELSAKQTECINLRNALVMKESQMNSEAQLIEKQLTVKSDEKAMSLIETLMGTYKSQIDESLRKHMDIVQNLEEKINKQSQIPVPAHLPKTSNPENILYSSPSKEELVIPMRNDALDNESPLTSLKKMLSSYMSSAASVSDSDPDWKVLESNYGDDNLHHMGGKIDREKQLLKDLTIFLKSENDFLRKKQIILKNDREKWRDLFQGNKGELSAERNSARNATADELNRRAVILNNMLSQIRDIQRWMNDRESKLKRLESIWKSASSIQQHRPRPSKVRNAWEDDSLHDHFDTLQKIEREMNEDLSLIGLNTFDDTNSRYDVLSRAIGKELYPKPSRSPDRNGEAKNIFQFSYNRTDSGGGSIPTLPTSNLSASMSHVPIQGNAAQMQPASSAMFANRLGASQTYSSTLRSSASTSRIGFNAQEYSDQLKSNLDACDAHADHLGNLRKGVSGYSSSNYLRNSYDSSIGALKENEEATSAPWDYSQKTFQLTSKQLPHHIPTSTVTRNQFLGNSNAHNQSFGLRKSIDNGDMFANKGALYRL